MQQKYATDMPLVVVVCCRRVCVCGVWCFVCRQIQQQSTSLLGPRPSSLPEKLEFSTSNLLIYIQQELNK